MNSAVAVRLVDLNRRFYADHARAFSETRLRLQPGVKRILGGLHGDERILDLGCGNGEMARELSRRRHHGSYLGLDFSLPLLQEAGRAAFGFPVQFLQADLAMPLESREPSLANSEPLRTHHRRAATEAGPLAAPRTSPSADGPPLIAEGWSVIAAFAVLHHIPGRELRLGLLRKVHEWLQADGRFIHSNWQFLGNPRLRARLQPWDAAGLREDDVDAGDYLLDWRRGGIGLRYVHQFDQPELEDLAASSGFVILESFYSDGSDRRSGLYQIWRKA